MPISKGVLSSKNRTLTEEVAITSLEIYLVGTTLDNPGDQLPLTWLVGARTT